MSENTKRMLTDYIDRVVCNRLLGPVILCAVVYFLFVIVFQLAEGEWIPLFNGEWTSPTGVVGLIFESMAFLAKKYITVPELQSMICDGVIGGVGGVMEFVPLLFFMFFFIAILEDSGYIARVAFIMDRVLRTFGLQGKSILAMIVSGGLGAGGCAVPGVMAARTLREDKDRLITILVAPFMNCGAKMPVYAMLIGAFFAKAQGAMMFLLWFLSWCFALTSAFFLRKFVIKGTLSVENALFANPAKSPSATFSISVKDAKFKNVMVEGRKIVKNNSDAKIFSEGSKGFDDSFVAKTKAIPFFANVNK